MESLLVIRRFAVFAIFMLLTLAPAIAADTVDLARQVRETEIAFA